VILTEDFLSRSMSFVDHEGILTSYIVMALSLCHVAFDIESLLCLLMANSIQLKSRQLGKATNRKQLQIWVHAHTLLPLFSPKVSPELLSFN
jgi:hypothetical protein